MLKPPIVRTASIALLVSMTIVACSGGVRQVETGIPGGRAVAPSTIAPGATIRFIVGTDSLLRLAHLSKLTADSLIVDQCTGCDRLRYGTGELSRLEVLRGSSRGRHFAIGLGAGALAGLIAATVDNARPCHALDTDVCGFRAIGFIYGPPIGALIGGIIGIALPTGERWEPVAIRRAVQ
jgi:hypothetical protein